MWSDTQSKTQILRQIHVYFAIHIKNLFHKGSHFLLNYFGGLKEHGSTSARRLVSPSTKTNTLAVSGITIPFGSFAFDAVPHPIISPVAR
jgi:hypothetical protein